MRAYETSPADVFEVRNDQRVVDRRAQPPGTNAERGVSMKCRPSGVGRRAVCIILLDIHDEEQHVDTVQPLKKEHGFGLERILRSIASRRDSLAAKPSLTCLLVLATSFRPTPSAAQLHRQPQARQAAAHP